MTSKITSIDDVILAVVALVDAAVAYSVYDGPPVPWPIKGTTKLVAIGTDTLEADGEAESASMDQELHGSGAAYARYETLEIPCIAWATASNIKDARASAVSIVEDVGNCLTQHITTTSYNVLISQVSAVRSRNVSGGAIVTVEFTISASARLT